MFKNFTIYVNVLFYVFCNFGDSLGSVNFGYPMGNTIMAKCQNEFISSRCRYFERQNNWRVSELCQLLLGDIMINWSIDWRHDCGLI